MGKCYSCFRAQFKPNEGKTPGLPLVPKKPDAPGELPRPPSVDSNSKNYHPNKFSVFFPPQNFDFLLGEKKRE